MVFEPNVACQWLGLTKRACFPQPLEVGDYPSIPLVSDTKVGTLARQYMAGPRRSNGAGSLRLERRTLRCGSSAVRRVSVLGVGFALCARALG